MHNKKDDFDEILESIKPENKIFVDFGLDIAEQVKHSMCKHRELTTQKKLAEKLGKNESEVSKWLSGMHNLTLESMSKLMAAFEEELIMTDLRAREKYEKVIVIYSKEGVVNASSEKIVLKGIKNDRSTGTLNFSTEKKKYVFPEQSLSTKVLSSQNGIA